MIFIIKNRHHIALAFFLLLHAVTLCAVPMFGDDFYYAGFVRNGADFFLSENVNHYLTTNGRALVHLLDELLIGFGLVPWKLASIAVMAAMVIGSAKLAARTYRRTPDPERYKNAVIAVCALFSLTSIHILRESVYWATGSLNYMFPAVLTLWFVYFMRRDFEYERGNFLLAIFAFFASMTTEQASAAALLSILWLILTAIIQHKKRLLPAYFTVLAASLAGFASLMLAPGNAARRALYPAFYAEPLIPRILHNLTGLLSVLFGSGGLWSVLLAAFLLLILSSLRRVKATRIAWIPAIISTAAAVLYLIGLTVYEPLLTAVWFLPIFAAPILFFLIKSVIDYFRRGETDYVYFILGAASMQAAMALSPVYGPRTLMISLLFLIVPVVRGFCEEFENWTLTAKKIAAVFVFLPLVWYMSRPVGYLSNLPVHRTNDAALASAVSGEPLTLCRLENRLYGYTMPYDDPYHERMLLCLYGLSDDTFINYETAE